MRQFDNLRIRCSALGIVCEEGRTIGLTSKMQDELKGLLAKENRTAKQEEKMQQLIERSKCKDEFSLSTGAMSYIEELVEMFVYKYKRTELDGKEVQKGHQCEDDSISLYNSIEFLTGKKNEIEMHNAFIQGTCDVDYIDFIGEFKTSWSKKTFPKTNKAAYNKLYHWQCEGYMELWARPKARLIYTLVDTPDPLIEWETNFTIHHMDDVPLHLRTRVLEFERSAERWEAIKAKVLECRRYANWYHEQITTT